MNSAIDAGLAKAVFDTIVSATPDGETYYFKRLSLRIMGNGSFRKGIFNYSITEIMEEVGKE